MYGLALVPAQVAEPFISRSTASGDLRAVIALLRRNVRYVGVLLAVGAPLAAVLGREIITVWVGAANFPGYPALWLMVLVYTLEAHHVLHATTVMATGRVVFLRPALIAGVITVVAGIFFARWWGLIGVVAGLCIAQVLTNNWFAPWYALRQLGIPLREYARWLRPLVPVVGVAAALAIAARLVLRSAGPITAPGVLLTLAALIAATAPLIWSAALSVEERFTIARAWRARRLSA
jgi:hypothetical protein